MRSIKGDAALLGDLGPDEALERVFARIPAGTSSETVPLEAARGRILAADVVSESPVPAQPRAAADGYAVRSRDASARAAFRSIDGRHCGKAVRRAIRRGEAVRVVAGDPVPSGVDAVVPLASVRPALGGVRLIGAVERGENLVPIGGLLGRGEPVLRAATRLRIADLATLASLGRADVSVYRRPIVGVISVGDELVQPGGTVYAWQTYDANRYVVGAAVRTWGARPIAFPAVARRIDAVRNGLRMALTHCDAVVVLGDEDCTDRAIVAAAIELLGDPGLIVNGLRMLPAPGCMLAAVGHKPIVGLFAAAGAALVALYALAAPIVRRLRGDDREPPVPTYAVAQAIDGAPGYTAFVPVVVAGDRCYPLPGPGGGMRTLARADAEGMVRISGARGSLIVGERVPVERFA